jgi:hypothetical protein
LATGLVSLVAAVSGALPTPAAAHGRSIDLRATFRQVLRNPMVGIVLTDGRYVFASTPFNANGTAGPAGQRGVVLDEQTGQKTTIVRPGCYPNGAIGGPWLAVDCGIVYSAGGGTATTAAELYSLATGQWTPVPTPPPLPCDIDDLSCSISTVALGSHWIEYDNTSCSDHCLRAGGLPDVYSFENLATGVTVADPRGPHTVVDLNSSTLSQRLCSPLGVPVFPDPSGLLTPAGLARADLGSMTLDGSFAIATRGLPPPGNGDVSYLERCGTRLHMRIAPLDFLTPDGPSGPAGWCTPPTCGPLANPHIVVWASSTQELSGVFLPSLTQFVIHLPALGPLAQIALTTRTLYVIDHTGRLWATKSPTTPPKARRHR